MPDVRIDVRERYARVAEDAGEEGCGCSSSCCATGARGGASERLGYDRVELQAIPKEADMGLGCGNPTAIGELRKGETVVDLGSGGGIDCFLAARKVGAEGRVIGVDMTPPMIDRARAAATRGSYGNVEFRLGEIENLPIADATADVVISNCVINLSANKPRVFQEAFRVLKPGGRLMVSDITLNERLPEALRKNVELWAGCVAGAMLKDEYLAAIRGAGFVSAEVRSEKSAGEMLGEQDKARLVAANPGTTAEDIQRAARALVSVQVFAAKENAPGARG